MSTNMVHAPNEPHGSILYQNGGSAQSIGQAVSINGLVAILKDNVAANGQVAAFISGVVEYARLTGATTAWAVGDKVYLDVGNNRFTKVSTANVFAGVAYEATADGDAVGRVLLNVNHP